MAKEGRLSKDDPNSYSRLDLAKVVDIHLRLEVDFDRKVLDGSVTLTVEKVDETATSLVLDARDLDIRGVKDDDTGESLDFELAPPGYVGSKLEIQLPQSKRSRITIGYTTSPSSIALQWLPPAQTAGKTHPYMFSQCQSIHCRSMIPLQDTPAVKSPYSAEITAPSELVTLMSAVRDGEPESVDDGRKTRYRFKQVIPIQSYLIAIAVGNVESRKIGPRSRVWSEKELVDRAAEEFSETEDMLQRAEQLCGPFVWGTYDILVLPPSFPYGGMENPCLTFVTPTLLAGDKSLASTIAHEICHSWSGNLVTNRNFEHFWLNEGFTKFLEYKILGQLSPHGEAERHFKAVGGWKELVYEVGVLGEENPLTALVVDLTDVDPEDAFSRVPYQKGATFLWYLEKLVGGADKFEPFLRCYFDHFKYQSIDSNQFKGYFQDYFKSTPEIADIKWEEWFNLPGMPNYNPNYDDTLAKVCKDLANKWLSWNEEDVSHFSQHEFATMTGGQKIEFLSLLLQEKPLSILKLKTMNDVYNLSKISNAEIRFLWIRLGLLAKWEDAVPRALEMITELGRMKYLRPIYRDLYNWEEKRYIAIETFQKNRSSMMHVAVQCVEKDLKLAT